MPSLPPTGTALNSGWVTDTGSSTNIYTAIDETSANDADYIRGSNGEGCMIDFGQPNVLGAPDPEVNTGHVLNVRYAKTTSADTVNLSARLLSGATTVVTRNYNGISTTATTDAYTLSGAEADLINYGSIASVEFVATITGSPATPAKVADRVTINTTTLATTFDYALTGLTVGNFLIIRTAADNVGGGGAATSCNATNQIGTAIGTPTTIQSNADPGAASAGITCNVIYAQITGTGGTVRVTYGGTVRQAGVAEEWSGIASVGAVVGTPVTAATPTTPTTAQPTLTDTSVASGNLAYVAIAAEGPSTDTYTNDSDTTNGSWVGLTKAGMNSGTATNDCTTTGAYKIVTATGSQSWNNATTSTARDEAGIILEFAAGVAAPSSEAMVTWTSLDIPAAPAVTQAAYQFYAEGTETGGTALGTQSTAYTIPVSADVNLGLRVRLQSTTAAAIASTTDWQLQYRKNGGGWTNTGTGAVFNLDTGSLTEGAATTNRLGAGTGTFVAGKVSEDGLADNVGWTANNYTELLYSITLKATDVADGDTITFAVLRNNDVVGMTYTSEPTLSVVTPAVTQAAYQFYADGTQTASVALGTQSTSYSLDNTAGDVNLGLRVRLQSTSIAGPAGTDDWQLQYSKNGGTWTDVGTGAVVAYASANLTDAATTTNRLGAGTGTFRAGEVSETGLVTDRGWNANDFTELLYSITLVQASLADSDSLTFRVLRNGVTTGMTYTSTPTVVIDQPSPLTQAAYRFYADGTESGSVALAAQDSTATADLLAADANLLLRVRLQSTTAKAVPGTTDLQLQWEKNASGVWSALGVSGVADSYTASIASQDAIVSPTGAVAQSFQVTSGGLVTQASFWLAKAGTPAASTLTATIYATTGTHGSTAIPTGAALSTSSTVAVSGLPGTAAKISFTFPGTFALIPGTTYALVVTPDALGPNASNCVQIGKVTASPTHAGNKSSLFTGGPSWNAAAGEDYPFEVVTVSSVANFASASLTEGEATTNRLTGGTGTFSAGKVTEDGLVDDVALAGNDHTELLYAVTLKKAELAHGDTVRFRVVRDASTTAMTYTATPTVSISELAGANGTQASEADTAITGSARLVVAGTQAVESSTATTGIISQALVRTGSQASEVDSGVVGIASSGAPTTPHQVFINRTSTNKGPTVLRGGLVAVDVPVAGSQVTESDTALAGSTSVARTGAQVSETDSTTAGALRVVRSGAQTSESSTATLGALNVTRTGTQVVESSTATLGTLRITRLGALASETDTATSGSVAGASTITGTQVTEVDTGVAGTVRQALIRTGTQASESSTAAPGPARITTVGAVASETDTAAVGTISQTLFKVGGQAAEVTVGAGGQARVVRFGSLASEADTGSHGALAVTLPGTQSLETDAAAHGLPGGATSVTGTQAVEPSTATTGTPRVITFGTQRIEPSTAASGTVLTAGGATGHQVVEADTTTPGRALVVVAGSVASESSTGAFGGKLVARPGAVASETDTAAHGALFLGLLVVGAQAVEPTQARVGFIVIGERVAVETDATSPGSASVRPQGVTAVEVGTTSPGSAGRVWAGLQATEVTTASHALVALVVTGHQATEDEQGRPGNLYTAGAGEGRQAEEADQGAVGRIVITLVGHQVVEVTSTAIGSGTVRVGVSLGAVYMPALANAARYGQTLELGATLTEPVALQATLTALVTLLAAATPTLTLATRP